MTAPLAWLLISALALLAPPSHGPVPWTGRPLAVAASPSQPKADTRVRVAIALLPRGATNVVVEGGGADATARPAAGNVRVARLPTGAPGPLELSVRFTLHGVRYTAPGGVIFVVPDT
ncbi:MAG TPA: hypothetical protein VHL51_02880 [Gaiellales bacterium]|jgi:hypothetical protein|nr:hypothetical protein [Gaiellales bacterium]